MKSKNTFKKFITCMLIAAIAITGISLESVTTANAATTASYVQKWGTVTMKPGDTKKVIVTDNDGNDITTKYKWTSSDKNIVKVNMDFVSQSDLTEMSGTYCSRLWHSNSYRKSSKRSGRHYYNPAYRYRKDGRSYSKAEEMQA